MALPLREAREHFERAYLQQQLILCNGKVGQLAKRVGMERTHLYRKLRSLGVDFTKAYARELGSLVDLEADGLVTLSASAATVTPAGAPLLRVIAMRFDGMISAHPQKHSRTI